MPVAFEATVTYFLGAESILFVQDGNPGVFVADTASTRVVPGDRVLVRGTTQASFRPIVIASSVTLLHHGAMPKPIPATFDQLVRAEYDCRLVTVHAVVRTADMRAGANVSEIHLEMIADGGYIDATVESGDESQLHSLLDAEVEINGVAGGKFDGKMQQTGILLHVPTLADVKILKRAGAAPQSIPITPMDEILGGYHVRDQSQRVRVHGTITYYQPGSAVVLQDGSKSLWIATETRNPLRIGDVADASGFPDAHNTALILTHGEIEDSLVHAPLTPQFATWRELSHWSTDMPTGHLYDLVSIEGEVVTQVRGAAQDEYVLVVDGQVFSAIYRHPDPGSHTMLPPMMQIPLGARIRVTGICMNEDTNTFNTDEELPFEILLRSFGDISVVAPPSLINVRDLVIAMGLMVIIVLAVGARGWFIERRVRRQTTAMAYIERRRSRILEDINGSLPLAEIIDQITELVSFKLKGAPCWCQIADGAKLGNCPKDLATMRVLRHEIPARSGSPLGEIFAAFDPLTKSHEIESESLSMAVGLAALAIETRRLYSDLRRRSEFDLLTDIHNRFSLDKRLDAQIEDARQQDSIFGLIYIDLDNFKRVNDVYGHHIGDLYLQEVARRMKRQLRSHDSLARLGGDEFAALVPIVRSRADVQEIALRLERSFDAPFPVDGAILYPAASVGIALYPEDAITKDGLLSTADAAMYVAKHTRHEASKTAGRSQISGLANE
jgi:diguanylate cyclase (GGDEF)-like protein